MAKEIRQSDWISNFYFRTCSLDIRTSRKQYIFPEPSCDQLDAHWPFLQWDDCFGCRWPVAQSTATCKDQSHSNLLLHKSRRPHIPVPNSSIERNWFHAREPHSISFVYRDVADLHKLRKFGLLQPPHRVASP